MIVNPDDIKSIKAIQEKADAYNKNFGGHFLNLEHSEISKDSFSTAWDVQQEKINKLQAIIDSAKECFEEWEEELKNKSSDAI